MSFKAHAWIIGAGILVGIAPAYAAGPFDGSYQGTANLVRSNAAGGVHCGGSADGRQATRRVTDNKVALSYGGSELSFDVGPDGAISGSVPFGRQQISAQGKISGTSMVVDYGSPNCAYRFEGNRRR